MAFLINEKEPSLQQ